MTNYMSHLHDVESVIWRESKITPGVRFCIRRVSLAQRIELTRRVRDLTIKNEFLRAGSPSEGMEAALGDLLAKRLYIEWGLQRIEGLQVDGVDATPELLVEKAPENLADEAAEAVCAELSLSADERKNS
jgi:hypothetical protein